MLTWVALSINNRPLSGVLLWQVVLIAYLLGPGPLLGHDEQGNPMYEGTPVHMLILPVGLFLAVVFYSIVSYLLLRARFGVQDY
jgi:hypothetical protein